MIYLLFSKYGPGIRAHVRPLVSSMEVLIKNISHVRVDKTQLGKQSAARPRDHLPLIRRTANHSLYIDIFHHRIFKLSIHYI